MFSQSLILRNIDTRITINKYYKNPRSITPKLMECIEGYFHDDLSLREIITMFNDGQNGLFNNPLNPLQTLVSVIIFWLSESKIPENSNELEPFLSGKGIDKNINTEDFAIILAKFKTPEIKCSDMNGNPIFDRVNFEEIKNKIKEECSVDFGDNNQSKCDGSSPAVLGFMDGSDFSDLK